MSEKTQRPHAQTAEDKQAKPIEKSATTAKMTANRTLETR